MTDLLTMGETMGAIRLSGPLVLGTHAAPSIAGSETNVAIAMARLGHSAAWLGCVGTDAFGDGVLRILRGELVNTDHVERRPLPTGLLVSKPAGLGTKTVDYHRSGSAGREVSHTQVTSAFTLQPKFFHVSGITPAIGAQMASVTDAALSAARASGATISFDINHRSRLWDDQTARPTLHSFAVRADIVIGGSSELLLITGTTDVADATTALLAAGVREVVWKEADSASVTTAAGCVQVPGLKTQVVDTIGAGDAFTAGYLSGHLDGLAPQARLQRAHLMGAFVVSQLGDWEGLPSRAQLDAATAQLEAGTFDSGQVLR